MDNNSLISIAIAWNHKIWSLFSFITAFFTISLGNFSVLCGLIEKCPHKASQVLTTISLEHTQFQ